VNTTTGTVKQVCLWGMDSVGRPSIILVSGKAGVGKTTFSDYFCRNVVDINHTVDLLSFAYPIKRCARDDFMWDGDKDKKGRRLLQNLGRVGREYDKDLWVKHLLNLTQVGPFPLDFYIVDDWRFPNEFEYLNKQDFYDIYTIRVISPDREILRGSPEYDDISETSLDSWENDRFSGLIYNTGSLDALNRSSIAFINAIFGKEVIK